MSEATLVYDDDCGFCTWWADWLAARADVRLIGFSELSPALRERLPADYERGAHLVTGDGVHSFGAAIEAALLRTPPGRLARRPVAVLRRFGWYERLREAAYRWVADHRALLGRVVSKPPRARHGGD